MVYATSWWRGYLSKKAWRRWQRTLQLRRSKCIALHQAITQCSHNQVDRAWKAWRTYAGRSIQRRRFVAKAIHFWQHKQLACMWLAWSHWIAYKHDKHQILQKAIHWCMHAVSSKLTALLAPSLPLTLLNKHSSYEEILFCNMSSHIDRVRIRNMYSLRAYAKAKGKERYEGCDVYVQALAKAWNTWKYVARQQARKYTLLLNAVHHFRMRGMVQAWQTWRLFMTSRHNKYKVRMFSSCRVRRSRPSF